MWKPIDTAPKNRMVLVFYPPSKRFKQTGKGYKGWVDVNLSDWAKDSHATMWYPLPEPPEAT